MTVGPSSPPGDGGSLKVNRSEVSRRLDGDKSPLIGLLMSPAARSLQLPRVSYLQLSVITSCVTPVRPYCNLAEKE